MERLSSQSFYNRFNFDKGNDIINKGDFSQIYLGLDKKHDRKVAIKIIPLEEEPNHYPPLKKWARLGKIENSALINYLGFYEVAPSEAPSPQPGFGAIIMDPIRGGDLSTLTKEGPDLAKITQVAKGIIAGLEVLHDQGIAHGNLKPGNILIQDIGHLHVRLGDYGFSHSISFDKLGGRFSYNSLKYIAPEQLEPKTFARRKRVEPNMDFWSLGVILYELCRGSYPFPAIQDSKSDLLTAILHSELPSDLGQIQGGLGQLVRACLERKATLRPQTTSDLWKLLSGELIWTPTGVKPPATPPAITSPPPKCRNCFHLNPPESLICSECHKALFGPRFLMGFKYPHKLGSWTIAFLTLTFLTLNFFYISHHQKFRDNGYTQLIEDTKALDWEEWIAVQDNLELVVTGSVIAILSIITLFFFWIWYYRVSSNLASLGSLGQKFTPLIFVLIVLGAIAAVIFSVPSIVEGEFMPIQAGNIVAMVLALLLFIPPLFALQEIWKGSSPSKLVEGFSWKKSTSSFLVFSWWLCSILLPFLLLLPVLPLSMEGEIHEAWFFLTVGITIGYWLIGVLFILRVNFRQSKKYRGWSKQAAQRRQGT